MQRTIRYQGAVMRDHCILLIQHRDYTTGHSSWLLPGGGLEGEDPLIDRLEQNKQNVMAF